MVVIYGSIVVRAEMLPAIARLAVPFVAEVRREEGCLAYDLSWDVAEPGRLHLLEHWADETAYLAHREQPHVAAWAREIVAAQETALVTTKLNATPR